MVQWPLTGLHNVANALSALAAARHVGVTAEHGAQALAEFQNVKRRMQKLACVQGVTVYDDFAHHPTAIASTLDGLRKQVGAQRIIAVIEPRSNSMKLGAHREGLAPSTADADQVFWYAPEGLGWDLASTVANAPVPTQVCSTLDEIIAGVLALAQPDTQVVIMSNGGFGGIHTQLIEALEAMQ